MRIEMKRVLLNSLGLLFMIVLYMLCLLDRNEIRGLSREDGPIETLGAFCFLLCSAVFLATYFLSHGTRIFERDFKRNIFYLLFACFFLVCFFEEISWGQRILGFHTPSLLEEYNRQKEFNFHNLIWFSGRDVSGVRKNFWEGMFSAGRLFTIFWFSYCVMVPVLVKFSSRISRYVKKIALPVVPMSIGTLFLVNYAIQKIIERISPDFGGFAQEIKETNVAFLFACIAIFELYGHLRSRGLASHYGKQERHHSGRLKISQ